MKLELTEGGIEFLLRSMAGGPTPEFCKITLGNGVNAGKQAKELSNPVKDIDIIDMYREGNFVTLVSTMNNSEIEERFRETELGVYITDPDKTSETGVILFAYGYSPEDEATVIPAAADYTFETVQKVMVYVGATENVSVVFGDSQIFATKDDLRKHASKTDNPHHVTAEQVGASKVQIITWEADD